MSDDLSRRCAVGYLSPTEIAEALRNRYLVPETAVYCGVMPAPDRVRVILCDPSFGVVNVGEECPELKELSDG